MDNYRKLEKVGEGELLFFTLASSLKDISASFSGGDHSTRQSRLADPCYTSAGTYGTVYKCLQVSAPFHSPPIHPSAQSNASRPLRFPLARCNELLLTSLASIDQYQRYRSHEDDQAGGRRRRSPVNRPARGSPSHGARLIRGARGSECSQVSGALRCTYYQSGAAGRLTGASWSSHDSPATVDLRAAPPHFAPGPELTAWPFESPTDSST